MAEREIRVSDNLWIKGSLVVTLVGGSISASLVYSNIKHELSEGRKALETINQTVIRETQSLRAEKDKDIGEIKTGIQDVRVELSKIMNGLVHTRQADTWIIMFRESMRAWSNQIKLENPGMKIPDMGVPDLPK